eukprot:3503371-Amphidinium_carterae.1
MSCVVRRISGLCDSNTRNTKTGRHDIADATSGGRRVCARCQASGPMKFSRGWIAQRCSGAVLGFDVEAINASLSDLATLLLARLNALEARRRMVL